MDLYSRKILSWQLSNSLDPSFCVTALEKALSTYGTPDVFNTDQADRPGRCCFVQDGAQFTSAAFTGLLEQHGIRISMDGKGRWIDNVFIERFWRSLKYEEVYLYAYSDLHEAKAGLERYFGYYNGERRHSSLGKQTPNAVYGETTSNRLQHTLLTPATALTPRPCS